MIATRQVNGGSFGFIKVILVLLALVMMIGLVKGMQLAVAALAPTTDSQTASASAAGIAVSLSMKSVDGGCKISGHLSGNMQDTRQLFPFTKFYDKTPCSVWLLDQFKNDWIKSRNPASGVARVLNEIFGKLKPLFSGF